MKTIERLKEILEKHKPEIMRRFHVKEIGIFGSYVRGEEKRNSDIDILVEFVESPGLFGFVEMEDYLSKILNVKVDLVMKSALKPLIGRHILKEVIYL
jgi:uncharacterized protein